MKKVDVHCGIVLGILSILGIGVSGAHAMRTQPMTTFYFKHAAATEPHKAHKLKRRKHRCSTPQKNVPSYYRYIKKQKPRTAIE